MDKKFEKNYFHHIIERFDRSSKDFENLKRTKEELTDLYIYIINTCIDNDYDNVSFKKQIVKIHADYNKALNYIYRNAVLIV